MVNYGYTTAVTYGWLWLTMVIQLWLPMVNYGYTTVVTYGWTLINYGYTTVVAYG